MISTSETSILQYDKFSRRGAVQVQAMVNAGKTVVAAAGRYKLPALRGALKGKLLNVLITDEVAAKELLDTE